MRSATLITLVDKDHAMSNTLFAWLGKHFPQAIRIWAASFNLLIQRNPPPPHFILIDVSEVYAGGEDIYRGCFSALSQLAKTYTSPLYVVVGNLAAPVMHGLVDELNSAFDTTFVAACWPEEVQSRPVGVGLANELFDVLTQHNA